MMQHKHNVVEVEVEVVEVESNRTLGHITSRLHDGFQAWDGGTPAPPPPPPTHSWQTLHPALRSGGGARGVFSSERSRSGLGFHFQSNTTIAECKTVHEISMRNFLLIVFATACVRGNRQADTPLPRPAGGRLLKIRASYVIRPIAS